MDSLPLPATAELKRRHDVDPPDQDDRPTLRRPPAASTLQSVAFLSTQLPQRCGLATFTADLMAAVGGIAPTLRRVPVAFADDDAAAAGPATGLVADLGDGLLVPRHDASAYVRAAAALEAAAVSVLCVQHEYGIFGGPDGAFLLDLLDATPLPVVTTLHTVLDRPSPGQARVMRRLLDRAARVVVMTRRSADIVRTLHGVGPDRLRVVPHGIPAPPPGERAGERIGDRAGSRRRAPGVGNRPNLLTFGLLSPGKGIEHAIAALPALARRWPDILYVVMGATHPNLLRERGEEYRDGLVALAGRLGVAGNVRFVNRFVGVPELMGALDAADLYLTPYLDAAQSVSGTLSYSYGSGTPVVSTPYRHAAELLADGRGVLVPFADPDAIAAAVAALLADPARMDAMRRAARRNGRRMLWPHVGRQYLTVFREAAGIRTVADAGP